MATAFPIKINGTTIKTPTKFKISRFNLTKAGRTSSGLMTMDLIAKKKKLFLTYGIISGADMQTILGLIDSTTMFFEVSYYTVNGSLDTITCYVGEIPTTLQRRGTLGAEHYWVNVDFEFIEQ